MELIHTTQDPRAEARKEFKARLQVALALALQLERKLIQWGERLEERRGVHAA
jgi:hypothetical protein